MNKSGLKVKQTPAAISFSLQVSVDIHREGDVFYAGCHALDVHSQGNTEEEVQKNIVEALQLFIESCFDRGVLVQVLKDCGFKPSRKQYRLKEHDDPETQMIDVPLPLLVADHVKQAQAN